jgi:diguanylate cyclase (GGDEF)-like protein
VSSATSNQPNEATQEPLSAKRALDAGFVALVIALATGTGLVVEFLKAGALMRPPFVLPLWVLVVGFALSERWIIHIPIRRSSHTLTLSEIVYVVGLLFAGPRVVVLAHVIGGAIGLVADTVVPWDRKLFNVANYAFSSSVGALCFQLITTTARGLNSRVWLAAFFASLVMSVLSLGGIAAAMTVTGHRPARDQLLAMSKAGLSASLIDGSLGALVAVTLWLSPLAALLFLPLVAAIFLSTRTFVEQSRHRTRLEFLHELTATLLKTSRVDDGLRHVLDKILAIFVCDQADIVSSSVTVIGSGIVDPNAGIIEWRAGDGRYAMSLPLAVDLESATSKRLVLQGRLVSAGPFADDEKSFAEMIADHLSMMLRHSKLVDNLAAANHEVRVDPLTRIGNRRQLQESFEHAQVDGQASTLVTLDLDGFKHVNDRFGHDTGDSVLVAVARSIRANITGDDVPVRLGGDEFGILVIGDGHRDRAADLAERLRLDLAMSFDETMPEPVGASLGVATSVPGEALRDLLRRADHAMYRAKHAGKGRVVIGGDDVTIDINQTIEP